MKKLLAFALLLLCVTPAFPQDSGTTAIDYGTKFDIQRGVFTTRLDLSYLNAPDTRVMSGWKLSQGSYKNSLVWQPDGKRIYYSDPGFIFSVS